MGITSFDFYVNHINNKSNGSLRSKKKKNKGNSNGRRTNVFGTPQKRAAFLRQMCAENLGSQPTFKHDCHVKGGKT